MKRNNVLRCWMLGLLAVLLTVQGAWGAEQNPGGPPAYTLRDCVEMALERSPRIQAAEDAIRKADADVGMAKSGFFPKVKAYASRRTLQGLGSTGYYSDSDYDDQSATSQGLQLSQALFAGLTIFNGYQRAVLAREYVVAEKEEAVAGLTLEVQSVFLERLRAVEQAKVYEAHLNSLEVNGRALEAMFAQRLVPYSDVLDVQAEISNARQKLSEAQNSVAVKTIELKGLMQVPFEQKAVFMADDWDAAYMPELTLEQIRIHAFENKPGILLARLAVQVVQKDRDMAMGAFAPRVNLTLSYNKLDMNYEDPGRSLAGEYDRDYTKEYGVGMLSVEWDLFTGGRDYHQLQRVKHEISRLQNNLKDQEALAYTEIEKSYTSFQEARSRARHALSFLKSSRENLAVAQARLDKSMGTLPELVLARSKVQDAESSLVASHIDCQKALANLNYAMGRRTSSLLQ